MYNLRYHIASLVAVFLALAMGLLLGTIVVDRGVLSSQQAALVSGLQRDFDEIRKESAAVKKDNATLTAFASDTVPGLVGSVLASRTVVIIASPENADTAGLAAQQIRAAGGTAAVATFSEVDFGLADDKVLTASGDVLGIASGSVTTSMVVTQLATEWSTPGDARLLTKALVKVGVLKMTGLPATSGAGGAVVTCAFDGRADGAVISLAASLSDSARFAAGVETTKRKDGCAAAAKEAGLSGVDDIDTSVGQVSLAWVLSGRAEGLFGVGADVDAAYPSPLFGAK